MTNVTSGVKAYTESPTPNPQSPIPILKSFKVKEILNKIKLKNKKNIKININKDI